MDILQAIVLGAIQGATEFIPISSSAHLVIVPWLLGWPDPGLAFSVALHLGTLIALFIYFRNDWIWLIRGLLRSLWMRQLDSQSRFAWLIMLGTIPGAIIGALLAQPVDIIFHASNGPERERGVMLIGIVMILLGVLLGLADRLSSLNRPIKTIGLSDAIVIGLTQAVAVIPGVSRSGSTITMGLFRNLEREAAARFSFYLAMPIIFGAGVKEGYDVLSTGLLPGDLTTMLVGITTAAIVGYLCIAWLLRFLQFNSVAVFVIYRVVIGLGIIGLALLRS